MEERRKETRKATSDYFLVYDRKTGDLLGRILDLTPVGAMMISDEPVEVSRKFSLKVMMPIMVGIRRHVNFEAETKWCTENTHCNWYEIGLQIIDVPDEDLETIEKLIGDWEVKAAKQTLKVRVNLD